MIIELGGLPGAGKSTLAKELEAAGVVTRVVVRRKLAVVGYFTLGFFFHPVLWLKGLAMCWQRPYWFSLWNFYFVRYANYYKASSTAGLALIDEGPSQNLLSCATLQVTTPLADSLAQLPPAIVLWLTVSESIRQTRLLNRPQPSWRAAMGKNWDQAMRQVAATVTEQAAEVPTIHLIMDSDSARATIARLTQ